MDAPRTPAARIPTWMHEDRDQLNVILARRSANDPDSWLLWDGVARLTVALDLLAARPEFEGGVATSAWQVGCWLSERLPAPTGTRVLLPSLLDLDLDLDDDNDALRAGVGDTAAALAATLTAPADADAAALLADVSSSVAGVTPLLARWELHAERAIRLLRTLRKTDEPPPQPA